MSTVVFSKVMTHPPLSHNYLWWWLVTNSITYTYAICKATQCNQQQDKSAIINHHVTNHLNPKNLQNPTPTLNILNFKCLNPKLPHSSPRLLSTGVRRAPPPRAVRAARAALGRRGRKGRRGPGSCDPWSGRLIEVPKKLTQMVGILISVHKVFLPYFFSLIGWWFISWQG